MCNDIYVSQDAFIVEDENTTLLDAQINKETVDKYNRYYYTLLCQGYTKEEAKKKADDRLELYFDIYMSRYKRNKLNTQEKEN